MLRKTLDSNEARVTILRVDCGSFVQYAHVVDEILSGDVRVARGMVHKLKCKFLLKTGDYLSNVGGCHDFLGPKDGIKATR